MSLRTRRHRRARGAALDTRRRASKIIISHPGAIVIFEARGTKKVVAVVDSLMASAAYWIASAADEIVCTPSGRAGWRRRARP